MDKTFYIGKAFRVLTEMERVDDSPLDPGMLVRITAIRDEDPDCCEVHFDLTEFDERNKPFEQANYHYRHGQPRLTAREAGWYKAKDSIYLSGVKELYKYFEMIEGSDKLTLLLEKFSTREDSTQTYAEWCEAELLKAL